MGQQQPAYPRSMPTRDTMPPLHVNMGGSRFGPEANSMPSLLDQSPKGK
jgi:hypothetical protein